MKLPELKTNKQRAELLTEKVNDAIQHDYTDPVSWYNYHKLDSAISILQEKGISENAGKFFIGGKIIGCFDGNYFFVTGENNLFKINCYYSPFQILVSLIFDGNYNAAINFVALKYLNEDINYLRIGVDYFKLIYKKDRFGIKGTELKKWKKDEIKDDHGKAFLNRIPKFDNFCLEPDNFNYQPVVDNCYNLYHPFRHNEAKGEIKWSDILMNHIFGDQVELGYRYLQCLYLHPKNMLPILVLVSRERMTGKTTFLNWLNMIFGDNCVMINPHDLTSDFNSSYATSNIIEIEETLIEKSMTVEKLKSLATGKFISVNEKFISNYKIPFFGKIILASNNEDKFAKVDEEEIRFFVRKVGRPIFKNHNIEQDLKNEIPSFLSHLSSLPAVDFSIGRVPFSIEELKNDTLAAVKKESKTGLYKDLHERFVDFFSNNDEDEIYFVPIDIKEKWYKNAHNIDINYIRTVLKNEFCLIPGKAIRYVPFGEVSVYSSKVGTAYELKRSFFGIERVIISNNDKYDVPF